VTSNFSTYDVTVADSNQKNFLVFLTCTCAPHFENSSATHAWATCKANVSHLDENIAVLWL